MKLKLSQTLLATAISLVAIGLSLYLTVNINSNNTSINHLNQSIAQISTSIGAINNYIGIPGGIQQPTQGQVLARYNSTAGGWIANVTGWGTLNVQMPSLQGPIEILFGASPNGPFVEASNCVFPAVNVVTGESCRNNNLSSGVVTVKWQGNYVEILGKSGSSDNPPIAIAVSR